MHALSWTVIKRNFFYSSILIDSQLNIHAMAMSHHTFCLLCPTTMKIRTFVAKSEIWFSEMGGRGVKGRMEFVWKLICFCRFIRPLSSSSLSCAAAKIRHQCWSWWDDNSLQTQTSDRPSGPAINFHCFRHIIESFLWYFVFCELELEQDRVIVNTRYWQLKTFIDRRLCQWV